jgi:hypothetical protein
VDVFGDLSINRQFRDLPRVRILHPIWPRPAKAAVICC